MSMPLLGEPETREHWAERNIRLVDILNSREFIYLYIMFVCFIFYGYYVINVFKTFGFDMGIRSDVVLTFVGSFGSLINGLCRILWSTLLDYYSFRSVFGALVILQISLIILV